jgi:hypothetical protein
VSNGIDRPGVAQLDAVPAPSKVWLVWASQGEYSDRTEWPLHAFWNEQTAKDECVNLLTAWRAADQVGRDEDGQLPDYDTPEERARTAAFRLVCGTEYDEPRFYACEIEIRPSADGGSTSSTKADSGMKNQ